MTVVSFITNKILNTNNHNHSPPYDDPWTIEINNLAERIKNDARDKLDKQSISRGMKLVLIAVDEYEQGNESIALDIYLTGVDKIMMALPSKRIEDMYFMIYKMIRSNRHKDGHKRKTFNVK